MCLRRAAFVNQPARRSLLTPCSPPNTTTTSRNATTPKDARRVDPHHVSCPCFRLIVKSMNGPRADGFCSVSLALHPLSFRTLLLWHDFAPVNWIFIQSQRPVSPVPHQTSHPEKAPGAASSCVNALRPPLQHIHTVRRPSQPCLLQCQVKLPLYTFSSLVTIPTRTHWSNALQTKRPRRSGLQSNELTGCEERALWERSCSEPATPISWPSWSCGFEGPGGGWRSGSSGERDLGQQILSTLRTLQSQPARAALQHSSDSTPPPPLTLTFRWSG
jgi:hypothetical protein